MTPDLAAVEGAGLGVKIIGFLKQPEHGRIRAVLDYACVDGGGAGAAPGLVLGMMVFARLCNVAVIRRQVEGSERARRER